MRLFLTREEAELILTALSDYANNTCEGANLIEKIDKIEIRIEDCKEKQKQ